LTNLNTADQPFKFQIPLDILGSSVSDLGGFPYQPGEHSWHGNTLFVKGAKSKFLNKNNIPIAKQFFPGMSLETLDAGHWGTCEQTPSRKVVLDVFCVSCIMFQFMQKGTFVASSVEPLNVVLMSHFRPNEFKELVVDFVART